MIEPWFSAESSRAFSALSLLALVSLLQPLAAQGRRRRVVLCTIAAGAIFGAVLLASAGIAAAIGQPPHVLRALGLSGALVTATFAMASVAARREYREAELRRTLAADM